jgi:hypothetical protein
MLMSATRVTSRVRIEIILGCLIVRFIPDESKAVAIFYWSCTQLLAYRLAGHKSRECALAGLWLNLEAGCESRGGLCGHG